MSASLRIAAWKDWWARHAAGARTAWDMRHELAGPRRETDELAFLPAHLSLRDTPPHPAPRRVAWALCGLLVAALVCDCWAQVDIVAIASDLGLMMHSARLAIAALRTQEGEHVHTLAGGTHPGR